MIVMIPKIEEHEGSPLNLGFYKIQDTCPICGAKRGIKRWIGRSYDGSRILNVDCWKNECSHIDTYPNVRKEGQRTTEAEYEKEKINNN